MQGECAMFPSMRRFWLIVFIMHGYRKRRQIPEVDLNLELEESFTLFPKAITFADERMEPLILGECKRVAA